MLFIFFSIAAATPILYKLFINHKHHSGAVYVKWILLSNFFGSFIGYYCFLYFYKMKKILFIGSAVSMLLALLLNFILIKNLGIKELSNSLNINCFIAMAGIILLLTYKFKLI